MQRVIVGILFGLVIVFLAGPILLVAFPDSGITLRLQALLNDGSNEDAASPGMQVLYQFIDDRGDVQIVEKLEYVPPEKRANVGRFEIPLDPPASRSKANKKRSKPQIIIYSTTWCGYCTRLKNDLNRSNIPYENRDVESSRAFREEFLELGGTGYPLTSVGGKVVRGYQPDRIKKLYDR